MIQTTEMLKVFQQYRGDAIVIPGRGGRHWVKVSTSPTLDAPLGDPAMGGHASFGLGLALAQPNKKVVLFDSEGDVLMGMGALATIAEQAVCSKIQVDHMATTLSQQIIAGLATRKRVLQGHFGRN